MTLFMKHILSLLAFVSILWGCSLVEDPAQEVPEKVLLGDTTDTELIFGEMQYVELEGGFWAIAGDTAIYDPINLPDTFGRQDLSVRVRAVVRKDMASIHMIGPIIEIRSIEAR